MKEKILLVDDEEYILNSIERLLADTDLDLLRASDALRALELASSEEIALVLTDNLMPGMKGVEMLARLRAISPDTVKILMTAHADLPTAMEAINRGEVYRFILKPWENEELKGLVEEGLHHYRLLETLRRGDEAMMLSLAQTIELKDNYTRGHCDRVAHYSLMLADALKLEAELKLQIKYGSWLHDCGKIGVPESILNFNGPLDEEQMAKVRHHPAWGAEVARKARLAEEAVNVIHYHHERWDGQGYPCGLKALEIPLEARIVAIADVYEALISDRPYRKAMPKEKAMAILEEMSGAFLDPELTERFLELVAALPPEHLQESREGHER